jgi:hypothetical protein
MSWYREVLVIVIVIAIIAAFIYLIGVIRKPYVPPSTLVWKDIKPHLLSGDVMLFKASNMMSKIAAAFDPTPFFHIALVNIGPDGKIFLLEHDNSKTIRRDGTFSVDFEAKMAIYPNSELAILRINRPKENNLTFDKLMKLFNKYFHKYKFQKNPLCWTRMVIKNDIYYKMLGENNKLLCIEQVSAMLRDSGVFKPDTNIHKISPSNYFQKNLPFSDGYSAEGPIPFKYVKS